MGNKNVILLTVISIATLLTAVVGASFAYFSTTVDKAGVSNDQDKVKVVTGKSQIKFAATGNKILMENAIPGDSADVTFTIQNDGDLDLTYDIKWTDVKNDFGSTATKDDEGHDYPEAVTSENAATALANLKYSLVCKDQATNTEVYRTGTAQDANITAPEEAGNIKEDINIAAGKTHECTLTVTFVNTTGAAQNYNQGRTFTGTVDVAVDDIAKQ